MTNNTQSPQWIASARLVRRTGFGATGPAVDAALKAGSAHFVQTIVAADPALDPGALATPPPTFPAIARLGASASADARHARNRQIGAQLSELTAWWVRRMVTVHQPFGEKLTFCWHNHFATAANKVRHASWMLAQNETLRAKGRGDFQALSLAILTDAAMLYWLDGEGNTASAPNENLSREFMELFALGHGDGYTETDVREGARALTGWKIRTQAGTSPASTYLDPSQHDNGSKTFLGVTGNLGVTGYCAAILARPAAAPYLVGRWWGQLVSDIPASAATVRAVAAAYGPRRDLRAMFIALLTRPEFAAAEGSLVADPVEWLVGAARALSVPVTSDAAVKKLLATLHQLGQVPFYPPNVSGWPSEQAWLSTAAATTRVRAALALAQAGDLSTVTEVAAADRLDAVGYLLGIGSWSARSTNALRAELANPPRLVALALNTSEYLVH